MILSTVHGSRLYGLAHSGSDYDTYEVVLQGRTRQRVAGSGSTLTARNAELTNPRNVNVGGPKC